MPERSSYEHGVPSWVDLETSDVEGAKRFYGGLFGWTATDIPTDQESPYTMFTKGGKQVAGGGPPSQPEVPPHWNTHINVDSVDDTVAKATAAGGSVIMPPMDVMDQGRMAILADPTGAMFGLWEAKAHTGAELVNEPGAMSWNELMTDDVDAAKEFYAQTFGWGYDSTEMPGGMTYHTLKVGDNMAGGLMAKTPDMGDKANVWGTYFGVEDVDAAAATVEQLGGKVIQPPFDVEGVGRMAVVADPQGAVFSIWTTEA